MQQDKRAGWKDRRVIAVAMAGAVILPAFAGFTLGRSASEPVEIIQVACGLPRETVSFSLPGTLLVDMHAAQQGAGKAEADRLTRDAACNLKDFDRLRFGPAQREAGKGRQDQGPGHRNHDDPPVLPSRLSFPLHHPTLRPRSNLVSRQLRGVHWSNPGSVRKNPLTSVGTEYIGAQNYNNSTFERKTNIVRGGRSRILRFRN